MAALSIVIVEDEPIVAADLARQLRKFGYRVAARFVDGESAVDFVVQSPPDLLLMDVNLAGQIDGIETVRRIQQHHADLPVVYLTANTDERTFEEARATTPAAFLSKPFRSRDLRAAVELAVQRTAHRTHPPEAEAHPPAPDLAPEESAFLLRDRIFVRHKNRLERLLIDDIQYVAAEGYYCRIVAGEARHLLNVTLKKFEAFLTDRPAFMRVHRSYLVNLAAVTAIDEAALYIGEQSIPTSRSLRPALLERFTRWS